jgi:glutathione S-transferase
MHLHGWQQLPLAHFPHIRRWMFDHIEALPCWEKTWIGEGFTTQKATV